MIRIKAEDEKILSDNLPDAENIILSGDLYTLLDKIDDLITAIGFDENWELNDTGLQLQQLYDRIYMQNV